MIKKGKNEIQLNTTGQGQNKTHTTSTQRSHTFSYAIRQYLFTVNAYKHK